MNQINGHGLSGPFRNEQEFKTNWIRCAEERSMPGTRYFCIETEETEPGFPDVMKLTYECHAFFYEMKIADANDRFTLQRSQPIFYRNHDNMCILVLVWSNKQNKLYGITASEIQAKVLAKGSLTLSINDFKEK